jgi:hypothetical protein
MPDRACRRAVATVFLNSILSLGSAALLPNPAAAQVPPDEATEATTVCTPLTLYSNDFETGSGLSDWTVDLDFGPNAADWRGIQSCAAHSGSKIFRFGGATCDEVLAPDERLIAFPAGATGITVPAASSRTRLSFWHRWDFGNDLGFCWLELSVDGSAPIEVPAAAIVEGTGYTFDFFFDHQQSTFVNTVVDLDAVCALVLGSGGCADHTIKIGFSAYSAFLSHVTAPGWYLDDVTVTACGVPPPPLSFYTVIPCRLADTRNPNGPLGGPAFQPGAIRPFTLTGICGIPATAKALSLNVTVTQPSAAGFLTLYPGGQPTPSTSSINFSSGQTRANNAVLPLEDGTGILQIYSAGGSVHVILDVNGYFQ